MKKLLLILAAVGMIFTACEGGSPDDETNGNPTEQPGSGDNQGGNNGGEVSDSPLSTLTCAPNEILYTTKYGLPIELGNTQGFGGNLVYNTYENGVGRLVFGNDVIAIPDNAFYGCNSMEYIKFPDSICSIGESAFYGCTSLKSVAIPKSVTSIGESAFRSCNSLQGITIPNGITSIGYEAFKGCTSLTSVTIPDSLKSFGHYAFDGCCGLEKITIPSGFTCLGEHVFTNCNNIKDVYINVSDLAKYCQNFSDQYPGNRHLLINKKEITELVIPYNVTSICANAFSNCISLTSVTIPDSVTSIGERAFANCTSLASITIPDCVTEIGGYAFGNCNSLTSVYCKSTTPPTGGGGYMFGENASGRKIYVPTASVDAYKSAVYWSNYASDIVGYDF